eukprot:jgi/Botrbrau1/11024/Bobra.101_1s0022.1
MEGSTGPTVCKVCTRDLAKYTCPRCNLRYCSLQCYKRHSQTCTENFYKEQTEESLREMKATDEDKKRMVEILKRLHLQDSEQAQDLASGPGSSDEEAAGEPLSRATLERLRRKVESGEDFDVEHEMTPEERDRVLRDIERQQVPMSINSWQPWWDLPGDPAPACGADGAPLVATLLAPSEGSGAAQRLPKLESLTKACPSPLLHWQLVDLLYAYCLVMRLYNGDVSVDPEGAAQRFLDASASLLGKVPPASPAEAVLSSTERACSAGLLGSRGRAAALAVLRDVVSIASLGRQAVLRALGQAKDVLSALQGPHAGTQTPGPAAPLVPNEGPPVSRLAEARRRRMALADIAGPAFPGTRDPGGFPASPLNGEAHGVPPVSHGGPGPGHRNGRAASEPADGRRVDLGVRKMLFMLSWANEAFDQTFADVAAAVEFEAEVLTPTAIGGRHAPAGAAGEASKSILSGLRGPGSSALGGGVPPESMTQPKQHSVQERSPVGTGVPWGPGKEMLRTEAVKHLVRAGTFLEPTGERIPSLSLRFLDGATGRDTKEADANAGISQPAGGLVGAVHSVKGSGPSGAGSPVDVDGPVGAGGSLYGVGRAERGRRGGGDLAVDSAKADEARVMGRTQQSAQGEKHEKGRGRVLIEEVPAEEPAQSPVGSQPPSRVLIEEVPSRQPSQQAPRPPGPPQQGRALIEEVPAGMPARSDRGTQQHGRALIEEVPTAVPMGCRPHAQQHGMLMIEEVPDEQQELPPAPFIVGRSTDGSFRSSQMTDDQIGNSQYRRTLGELDVSAGKSNEWGNADVMEPFPAQPRPGAAVAPPLGTFQSGFKGISRFEEWE